MSRPMSILLDLVRFSAACVVVASHLCSAWFSPVSYPGMAGLGVFAVGIFFALSGFVIEFSVTRAAPSLRDYLVARLARLLSVLPAALGLTYGLLWLGLRYEPKGYAAYGVHEIGAVAPTVVSCLSFLNESWWFGAAPPTNGPVWSLGYEMPYYLMFAGLFYGRGRVRRLVAPVCLILWGFPILLLFPTWLVGCGVFRFLYRHRVSPRWGAVALLLIPLVVLVGVRANSMLGASVWARQPGFGRAVGFPLLAAGTLTLALVCVVAKSGELVWSRLVCRCEAPIRLAASATFSIYLFHLPVLCALGALPFYPRHSRYAPLMIGPAALAVCFGFSRITEAKKEWWKARVNGAIDLAHGVWRELGMRGHPRGES